MLTLKNDGTDGELAKACYVSRGHRDMDKSYMIHSITNFRQSSTRIIVLVAAIKDFRTFSHDVTKSYLQNEEKLTGKVFLLPKRMIWCISGWRRTTF